MELLWLALACFGLDHHQLTLTWHDPACLLSRNPTTHTLTTLTHPWTCLDDTIFFGQRAGGHRVRPTKPCAVRWKV
ncbi:hypothetical protein BZA05DRAFT_392505 [Tricharina praecox]|uniref:uncharacterized protein n=1 Tax=Tricharina praecox TaxID=43433 RepID=UPI0022204A54|nr:uncharacterized protein BZA05DRAFT_392505 [Tricharina praecox]KAI5854770.1 hypothetical protein BZA05DRAFT_392505 [Tricharina praecox]